jgi:STAS-like domain of unknown function (DUF4325)
MPSPSNQVIPIEQKGKRIFVDVLESHKHFGDLLRRIEHLFRNPATREVVFYFRLPFRLFPNVVAPLASVVAQIRRQGRSVRVLEEFDDLRDTNYFYPLSYDAELDVNPHGKVWRYSTPQEAQALHRATIDYLETHLIWEPGTLQSLEWSLYEVFDNVFQHAETPEGYFMFQVQQGRRRLSFCVADQGRGILKSFAKSRYRPATAADAISLSVQRGVTRDPDVGMGNGLWGATEIVARNEGQLTISSSGAALYFNRASRTVSPIEWASVLDVESPGTYIDVQVDASRSVKLSDLFDEPSVPVNLRVEALEGEHGFPVFQLHRFKFGTGTRKSGALAYARTINMLNESTAPVILDFANVGIISSSFADEFIAKLMADESDVQHTGRLRIHGLNTASDLIVRNAIAARRARA